MMIGYTPLSTCGRKFKRLQYLRAHFDGIRSCEPTCTPLQKRPPPHPSKIPLRPALGGGNTQYSHPNFSLIGGVRPINHGCNVRADSLPKSGPASAARTRPRRFQRLTKSVQRKRQAGRPSGQRTCLWQEIFTGRSSPGGAVVFPRVRTRSRSLETRDIFQGK
jgi:hypothetical protein